MDVQRPSLFDVTLPESLAGVLRNVELRAGHAIEASKVKKKDAVGIAAVFGDDGVPRITCGPGAKPTLELVAIELLRLELRHGARERRMPYADMRHEANRALCQQLYRIMEQEVLLATAAIHGIDARSALHERGMEAFLEPLEAGKYRSGEGDPARQRSGALDALELAGSYVDHLESQQVLRRVAEADEGIAGPAGLMYSVVANHRPFEDERRIRAAYYLAVPFLFDTRKPTHHIPRVRS